MADKVVNKFYFLTCPVELITALNEQVIQTEKIIMNQTEELAALNTIKDQLAQAALASKAQLQTLQDQITALQNAATNAQVPAEVEAAITAIQAEIATMSA